MHMRDFFRFLRPAPVSTPGGLIAWDPSFSVGNGLIDGEHKAILRLLNRLYDDWAGGLHALDLPALVDEVDHMLVTHFANEEAVLQAHNCPSLAAHRQEHHALLAEFTALANGPADAAALARFLKRLVVDHVLGHDLTLKPYLRR